MATAVITAAPALPTHPATTAVGSFENSAAAGESGATPAAASVSVVTPVNTSGNLLGRGATPDTPQQPPATTDTADAAAQEEAVFFEDAGLRADEEIEEIFEEAARHAAPLLPVGPAGNVGFDNAPEHGVFPLWALALAALITSPCSMAAQREKNHECASSPPR